MSIYCYGCGLSICIKRLSMNGSIPLTSHYRCVGMAINLCAQNKLLQAIKPTIDGYHHKTTLSRRKSLIINRLRIRTHAL